MHRTEKNSLILQAKHSTKFSIIRYTAIAVIAFMAVFGIVLYAHHPIAKILMYHSILKPGERIEGPYIDSELFARQLEFLKKHGYETVFIRDIIHLHLRGQKVPSNWVALTFDDGYRDFYAEAFSLLKKYRYKATLFIIPSFIGLDPSRMNWEEIKEVRVSGLVRVGVHGFQHDALTQLSGEEAKRRVEEAKKLIKKHLGVSPPVFAYPYGAQNEAVQDIVEETDFKGAVGTVYSLDKFRLNDIYNLRRIYVSEWSRYPLVFRFMLSGYYVQTRGLLLRLLNIKTPRDAESG